MDNWETPLVCTNGHCQAQEVYIVELMVTWLFKGLLWSMPMDMAKLLH